MASSYTDKEDDLKKPHTGYPVRRLSLELGGSNWSGQLLKLLQYKVIFYTGISLLELALTQSSAC
jgi:hypothetical protein